MSHVELANLDCLIKELEDRLEKYRAIRTFAEEDPTLLTRLTERAPTPEANGKIKSHPAGKEPGDIAFGLHPNAAKMVNYLKSLPPDEWVSARQIEAATGVLFNNVYSHLHVGLRDIVVNKYLGKKAKVYRLKPELRSPK